MRTTFILSFLIFVAGIVNTVHGQSADSTIAAVDSTKSTQIAFWDSVPAPQSWTTDFENLFSHDEKEHLDSLLRNFEKETTIEIAIVTLDTGKVNREIFDERSFYLANTWKVGKKESNNGILIAISKGLRRIRINNGFGIEKILSDSDTKKIIDNFFIPEFKNGNYFSGTVDGVTEIMRELKGRMK